MRIDGRKLNLKEMEKRGRPRKLDYNLVNELLLLKKDEILFSENKVLSKDAEVWKEIAKNVNGALKTIYSYVVDNKNGIRVKLRIVMENSSSVDLDVVPSKKQRLLESEVCIKIKIKYFLIFLNHFSRLCRSLEECITVRDNGTLLYRPYQPMIKN